MRLKWVDLDCFRNLENQKTELHPRYNLLLGRNGQGKTNFLEAVGYLGSLRSFRSAGRSEMIRKSERLSRISGGVISEGSHRTLTVALTTKERTQFLDEKRVTSPEDYLQVLKTVHFIPEDVGLVSGSPSWRRKVIDRAVFEVIPQYVTEYRKYLLTLRQRNALLRRGVNSAAELGSWNSALASSGATLVERRLSLINSLNPLMAELGDKLGLGEGLGLVYTASFDLDGLKSGSLFVAADGEAESLYREPDAEPIRERILESLAVVSDRETRSGHTLVGPHRDKIFFALDTMGGSKDLARYGSQGQKRSSVLAFKLALAINLHRTKGVWPIILLDDVASELDAVRRKALGKIIRSTGAQFLISTTGEEYMFLPADEGKIFQVREGRLEPFSQTNRPEEEANSQELVKNGRASEESKFE
jgi:DNA replication and repair protein RecF